MAFNFKSGLTGAGTGALAGSSFGPIGAGVGGVLGLLSGFGGNPADRARKDLNAIPGTLKPYYDPFINAGTSALPKLQEQYGQLMSDPNAIISRLGAGYRESPGYKWNLNQGEQAINNASAAGGMIGSNEHQQHAGELAGHLADQDFQEYLNHILGLYGTGLSGEQGLETGGQNASTDLAQSLAGNQQSKALLGYEGAAGENKNSSDLLSSLVALLTKK